MIVHKLGQDPFDGVDNALFSAMSARMHGRCVDAMDVRALDHVLEGCRPLSTVVSGDDRRKYIAANPAVIESAGCGDRLYNFDTADQNELFVLDFVFYVCLEVSDLRKITMTIMNHLATPSENGPQRSNCKCCKGP